MVVVVVVVVKTKWFYFRDPLEVVDILVQKEGKESRWASSMESKHASKQTKRETDRQTLQTVWQTGRQTDRHTDIQADTDRQAGRQIYRLTQTDKQIDMIDLVSNCHSQFEHVRPWPALCQLRSWLTMDKPWFAMVVIHVQNMVAHGPSMVLMLGA